MRVQEGSFIDFSYRTDATEEQKAFARRVSYTGSGFPLTVEEEADARAAVAVLPLVEGFEGSSVLSDISPQTGEDWRRANRVAYWTLHASDGDALHVAQSLFYAAGHIRRAQGLDFSSQNYVAEMMPLLRERVPQIKANMQRFRAPQGPRQ